MSQLPTIVFNNWLRLHAAPVTSVVSESLRILGAGKSVQVVTVNPEIYQECVRDSRYRALVERAEICTCDGIGLTVALRVQRKVRIARVTGVDLARQFLAISSSAGVPVVVIGAKASVREAFEIVARKGGAYVAAGHSDEVTDTERVAKDLCDRLPVPAIVLVALGAPKQEFVIEALRRLSAPRIYVGIGGAIDYLSGVVPRAPPWMQVFGLEWLYRLVSQPGRRLMRQCRTLPEFAVRQIVVPSICRRRPPSKPAGD